MSLVRNKQKALNAKFVEACFDGLHKDIERLLSEGAFIEAVERNGYTALSEASIAGHTIVVGQLLRALANPNSKANDGRTPLHRAAFHGWQPVIYLLLDHGADPKIRDESGMSPADLARTAIVRKQITDFPEEKTEAAKEERKRKLAERPPPPVSTLEEDQASAVADDAAPADSAAAGAVFKPPPRGSAAEKAAAKAEAQAKAEAKKKAAADAAKADKERREQCYKDAMEELKTLAASGEDLGESGYNIADAPRPLTARVEVVGAAESRLNGIYQVVFAMKDRIEFVKVDDKQCQIFWSSWQDEWRMLIGDYKMGSTLYRNNYRPNWKADVCNGCPVDNWQKWFGKEGTPPTVRLLPEPEEALNRLSEVAAELSEKDPTADAAGDSAAEAAADVAAESPSSPSGAAAAAESAGKEIKKTSEFLELHSNLNIVSVDDGAARRSAATPGAMSGGQSKEIQLTLGGERIVETADGLFGAGEVQVEDKMLPAVEEPDQDAQAQAWLESSGSNQQLPANWESILAAKGTAQELYMEQRITEACQATTAAIQALKKFVAVEPGVSVSDDAADGVLDADKSAEQSGQRPDEKEIEGMRGVLHSNRSLLLQHQILAGDTAVLAFGADAAWRLVVNDADVALRDNPTNFKASFRRARALLELGELEEALQDATNVVDYYASSQSTPNPEAAALRERILDAIRKERGKWGEKGPRRWNRSAKDLVTEVSSSSTSKVEDTKASKDKQSKAIASSMPWETKPSPGAPSTPPQCLPDASNKALPAPRNSSDVEKALLTTLKTNRERQLAYVREHLPVATLRRFYKRSPLGPDLLARLIRISADLAEVDAQHAEDLVCALAVAPSAKTDAAMFDAEEQDVLQRLTSRLGSKATEAWAD